MATLKTLKDDIRLELDKPDIADIASSHIALAIRHYEREPLWFNEGQATAATTSGTEFYSLPPDFVAPISPLMLTKGGQRFALEQFTHARHEEEATGNISATGMPYAYSFLANQIRAYPIPDSSYNFTLTYIKRLTALNSAGASNSWVTEAEELIKARAQKTLSLSILGDAARAQGFSLLEEDALTRLKSETLQRTTLGKSSRWGF